MIGVSVVAENYPLYCDAINEKGLGVAGLNFVGPCKNFPVDDSKKNIVSFELIPYLLGNCQTIADVKRKWLMPIFLMKVLTLIYRHLSFIG